jgi:hypothetical protein
MLRKNSTKEQTTRSCEISAIMFNLYNGYLNYGIRKTLLTLTATSMESTGTATNGTSQTNVLKQQEHHASKLFGKGSPCSPAWSLFTGELRPPASFSAAFLISLVSHPTGKLVQGAGHTVLLPRHALLVVYNSLAQPGRRGHEVTDLLVRLLHVRDETHHLMRDFNTIQKNV